MMNVVFSSIQRCGQALLNLSHSSLTVIGLVAVTAVLVAGGRADVRQQLEVLTLAWLQDRSEQREVASGNVLVALAEPAAVDRATAADIQNLPQPQAQLARWITRRYKVAPEPISALVHEAWSIGQRTGLEPTLILAIMAVESSFNPFAQSAVGAQGLMQVMTHVHSAKYQNFGGRWAAFDPISNLRVGAQVLKDCITRAGGGVEDGLRHYVGAALLDSDGGYAQRVLAEQAAMLQASRGGKAAKPKTAPAVQSEQVALLR